MLGWRNCNEETATQVDGFGLRTISRSNHHLLRLGCIDRLRYSPGNPLLVS